LEDLVHDVRYGVRMLLRRPLFTLVAVLSLALGIGANTTIFTILNALLGATVPVEEPERLINVHTVDWENPGALTGVSLPNYEDYRDRNTLFEGLAAIVGASVNMIVGGGEPESVSAQVVSGNYFDVLGVPAALGRTFRPEEDQVPTPVVVLSYGLWENRFGSDPAIVGSQINIAGMPFDVIGVAAADFKGLRALGGENLVWIPMEMRNLVLSGNTAAYIDTRRGRFTQVIGRLREGMTIARARAEIQAIGAALQEEYPTDNVGREGEVSAYSPISPRQEEQYTRIGGLMMLVVGVVLLIACANVANLLLARAADREKEVSIRVALGAERGRLVRQLLTESVLLALCGAAVGMVIAYWGRDLLWAYRPPGLGGSVELGFDLRVFGFTMAVALFTGLLFGLAPALQASKPDLKTTLQEGGRRGSSGSNRHWLRSGLVVAEIALALATLIGAGLFVRSLRNAQAIDPGFERERLVLARLNLQSAGYTDGRGRQFFVELLDRLDALPGVDGAALQSGRLLGGGLPHTTMPESTNLNLPEGRGIHVHDIKVTPGYFATVGIPLLKGRLFDEFDRKDTRKVAVVNEATVQLFWSDRDPIGQRFRRTVEDWEYEVVGVVQDALIDLGRPAQPIIYTSTEQFYQPTVEVEVLAHDRPETTIADVRAVVRDIDPDLLLQGMRTIGDALDSALSAPRAGVRLLSVFGGLALLLALVGVYGVMSYNVAQRHHEIGIRIALGAGRTNVVGLVLKQGMTLVGLGITAGFGVALFALRLIQSMLWGVSAADPLTFAVVALFLLIAAFGATLIPALRVTGVDPLKAMRDEY
jgi:putative ABC transport system permease protein